MPEVVYEMSLKDRFTGPMHQANAAAETLHGTMTSLLTTLGIGFGLYKLVDYLKEAREEVEKIHQGEEQLQAGLASTHHAAGVNFEELEEKADKLAHSFKYTKAEILDMQSLLLTFPSVTEKTFDGASQAILDMSAKLHKGASEVAIMVGKALQDPARGILALRRVGVNFDKEHSDRIKKMVAQGHILQAQAAILKELQTEFAGSAAANVAADPLFEYNKSLEETKELIGAVVVDIQKELAPTLLYLAERFRDLVDWLKKNGAELWNIIKALGAAYLAFKVGSVAMAGYSALMEGLAGAEAAAATATEGFAAASTAALGPIGLIAIAVGGLVAIYGELKENIYDTVAAQNEFSKPAAEAEKRELDKWKEYYKGKKYSDDDATYNAVNTEKIKLTGYLEQAKKELAVLEAKKNTNEYLRNPADIDKEALMKATEIATRKSQLSAVDAYAKGPKDISKGKNPAGEGIDKTKAETKGAKGNKVVTINIKIDSLIKDFQIKTTNIKEGTQKVQEMVTQVMMNAVNNAQIVSGN